MVAGVCGGVAEYFEIDPTVVRIAFVLLTIFNGAGVALYILMWIIVPERGEVKRSQEDEPGAEPAVTSTPPKRERHPRHSLWGLILVLLGAFLLLQELMPWRVNGALLVPTILIAVGLVFVTRAFDS